MPDIIKTKLLFEYKSGQLIGLGFGNIINSEADILVLSAFDVPSFDENSTIGVLNELLKVNGSTELRDLIGEQFGNVGYQMIDLSSSNFSFKKILLVCMGKREYFKLDDKGKLADLVINNLRNGLEKARLILSRELSPFTIDITALGTRYGGVRRKESFDMLINWATDLFNSTTKGTFLRFVAYDLDTFVDFFESVHRLQKIKASNELTFSAHYDTEHFSIYKVEISSALKNLDENPRGVIITCRLIIESIVKARLKNSSIKLADGIAALKDSTPPNIFSYLTTCRLLGNFSNHDPEFVPTRRDAEGILLLTLRIVEWHLSNEKG
ncbi:MAG TPA: DUF4145 domain-containing protein [Chitinophagaceae bacterium]|nr:DUF4145 domain-containing protein [Chitinophagaceae bacterium]